MPPKLAFVHTLHSLIPLFDELAEERVPGIERLHLLDEPLLRRAISRGSLAPDDSRRLADHVQIACDAGASVVLVTCSSISPCVDDVRPDAPIPIVKIDEAMIAEAVREGTRIGILATNPGTMGPTTHAVLTRAKNVDKEIVTVPMLREEAYEFLREGNAEEHDRIIAEAAEELAAGTDIVILAQASMARATGKMSPETQAKVITSPETAISRAVGHLHL